MSLLELLDVWTETEWEPIYQHEKPPFERIDNHYKCTRAEWNAWMDSVNWCRDCGGRAGYNQGGSDFIICDDCAQLDGCLEREHEMGSDVHVSVWGAIHPAGRHDALARAQERRRQKWRTKQEVSS